MGVQVGVLRFLGTNCDQDVWAACENVGLSPEWLWYEDSFDAKKYQALYLPGGFSYGDYLRSGALAAKSKAMESVREAAKFGVPILGICNGFQILCESGLLPGALMKNQFGKFIDQWVDLDVSYKAQWTAPQKKIRLPIAHGDGRYFANSSDLKKIQDQDQIWLRYFDNPNGSEFDIAGVRSQEGHVYGLMPHPERAMEEWMGGTHGRSFFEAVLK